MLKERVIIVFGMGPAGLFLARQLKKEQKTVYGIGKPDDIGRYSNTLKRYFVTEQVEGVRAALQEILLLENSAQIGGYLCSDQYLTMFLESYPDIFSAVNLSEPGQNSFQLIYDKARLVQYCQARNLNFPVTFSPEEVLQGKTPFPLTVKPNIKRGRSRLKKVYVIQSYSELTQFLQEMKASGYTTNNFLFQQYVSGDNRWEYGYGGYFHEGCPITDVFFVQARQFPQGVSCYTVEIGDKDLRTKIREAVTPFLTDMNYTGFLQFDLKQDEKTKQIFVLDINPRPWGSISILSPKCSVQSVFQSKEYSTRFSCWHFPMKELVSFLNRNNVPYRECRNMEQEIKVVDLFDKKDLKPFFAQMLIAAKKLGIRIAASHRKLSL